VRYKSGAIGTECIAHNLIDGRIGYLSQLLRGEIYHGIYLYKGLSPINVSEKYSEIIFGGTNCMRNFLSQAALLRNEV
jgi:hypothetical protein